MAQWPPCFKWSLFFHWWLPFIQLIRVATILLCQISNWNVGLWSIFICMNILHVWTSSMFFNISAGVRSVRCYSHWLTLTQCSWSSWNHMWGFWLHETNQEPTYIDPKLHWSLSWYVFHFWQIPSISLTWWVDKVILLFNIFAPVRLV